MHVYVCGSKLLYHSILVNKNPIYEHLLDSFSFTVSVCPLLQLPQLSLTSNRKKLFRHIINLKYQYLVDLKVPYCGNSLSIFHPEATWGIIKPLNISKGKSISSPVFTATCKNTQCKSVVTLTCEKYLGHLRVPRDITEGCFCAHNLKRSKQISHESFNCERQSCRKSRF